MRRLVPVVVALLAAGPVLAGCKSPTVALPAGKDQSSRRVPEVTQVSGGTPAASPSPTVYVSPSARPTPMITLSVPPRVTASPATPYVPCAGHVAEGPVNGISATTSATTATVTWWNVGDVDVVSYHIAAVSQVLYYGAQPALNWVDVAPGTGCRQMSGTITGLRSQTPYVFLLRATITNRERMGFTDATIGRSIVFTTP